MLLEKLSDTGIEWKEAVPEREPISKMASEAGDRLLGRKAPGAERIGVPIGKKDRFHVISFLPKRAERIVPLDLQDV